MDFKAELISYHETGYFSRIVTDLLSEKKFLKDFYSHPASIEGIKEAIASRQQFNTNRDLLATELTEQYSTIETSEKVKNNINSLRQQNTFTVCTAHQPNIFTGHLYFIYKIIHTIKLADTLNKDLSQFHFVPVFYVGSEDADLEELGEVSINGEKFTWNTKQTGAVGRMIVDDDLIRILKKIKGEVSVEPFGKEVMALVQECYQKGRMIQDACFCLVNKLFGEYGLLVLLPDNARLKMQMQSVFEDDIFSNTPSDIVSKSSHQLALEYKVQAHPREINLFYLQDGVRNRIIEANGLYKVVDTAIQFTKEELQQELNLYPERFSPNVILRAMYQETILPNLVFVGGGGELAYWLELKDMFSHYKVPYPVLLLRNSFSLVTAKINSLMQKLELDNIAVFRSDNDIIKKLVEKNTSHRLSLEDEKQKIHELYAQIKSSVKEVDETLTKHVQALLVKQIKTLDKLEEKLLRAEKRNFESQQKQVKKIRSTLFPDNSLQERVDNFIPFYARWGKDLIKVIYDNSLVFEQQFCVITEE
jgi:bacillithiol biosynthesis cysteine-adding enzyme BshC